MSNPFEEAYQREQKTPTAGAVENPFEAAHQQAAQATGAFKRLGRSAPYDAEIARLANQYGIPEPLFYSLVQRESAFNPQAQSKAGAYGLAQLMPGTAAGLGVNPKDPMRNLEGGARYLSQQFKTFGSWDKALAAYNAGPGAVQKHGGIPPFAETQAYVRWVLRNAGMGEPGAVKATTVAAKPKPQPARVTNPDQYAGVRTGPMQGPPSPLPPDIDPVAYQRNLKLFGGNTRTALEASRVVDTRPRLVAPEQPAIRALRPGEGKPVAVRLPKSGASTIPGVSYDTLNAIATPSAPMFLDEKIGNAAGRGREMLRTGLAVTTGDIEGIAKSQQRMERYPASREAQAMNAETGLGGWWQALKADPLGIMAEVMTESTVAFAPALAVGGVASLAAGPLGLAAGVGGGSFAIEYSASIIDGFREAGVDVTDPESLRSAFGNKNLMGKVRSYATKRGVAVAAFDALSAGLAGRLFSSALKAPVTSVARAALRKTLAGLTETAFQGFMGMSGEYAGQIATEGRITNWGAGATEFVAELPGGIGEIATGTGLRTREGAQATPEAEAVPAPATPESVIAAIASQGPGAVQPPQAMPPAPQPAREAVQMRGTNEDFMRLQDEWRAQVARGELTVEEMGRRTVQFVVEKPRGSKPKAAQQDTVENILSQYDDGDLGTVDDLVAALTPFTEEYPGIQSAIENLRIAQKEDRFEFGLRGDSDAAEAAFLNDVKWATITEPPAPQPAQPAVGMPVPAPNNPPVNPVAQQINGEVPVPATSDRPANRAFNPIINQTFRDELGFSMTGGVRLHAIPDDVLGKAIAYIEELIQQLTSSGRSDLVTTYQKNLDVLRQEQQWRGMQAPNPPVNPVDETLVPGGGNVPAAAEAPAVASREAPVGETQAKEPWEMTREDWRQLVYTDPHAIIFKTNGPVDLRGNIGIVNGRVIGVADGLSGSGNPIVNLQLSTEMGMTSVSHEQFHKATIEQALVEGKPVPPEVLADYPDLAAKYAPEMPALTPEQEQAIAPAQNRAASALAEINRAEQAQQITPGTAAIVRALIERDPTVADTGNVQTVLAVSDVVQAATPDILATHALAPAEGAVDVLAGETTSRFSENLAHVTIGLFKYNDAAVAVEEFGHRGWDLLSSENSPLRDTQASEAYVQYHDASGDQRTVAEHFAQEFTDFYFSGKFHEQAGPIRRLFENLRAILRDLVQRMRDYRERRASGAIPDVVENIYRRVAEGGIDKRGNRVENTTGVAIDAVGGLNSPRTAAVSDTVASTNPIPPDMQADIEQDGFTVTDNGTIAPTVITNYSVRTWTDAGRERLRQAAQVIAEPSVAERWISSLDNVQRIILDNELLDYEPSELSSALKANSDPHYKKSLDFSTLCRKRIVMQATIEAVQVALARPITSSEFLHIRQRLKDAGQEVSCGACYVETRRMNVGPQLEKVMDSYPGVPRELFLTQRGMDTLQRQYPDVYAAVTGKAYGSGAHAKVQESRTEYRDDILRFYGRNRAAVRFVNRHSGLRWQSWSDFELPHLLDGMQAIADMFETEMQGHAYAKVPDFVRAFGRTGLMINMSLIPAGTTGLDANGRLLFDPREGMPFETALALRDEFSQTAGTIAIGASDEQIWAMFDDPRIDYIIPYHSSGLSIARRKAMGMGWSDYEDYQNPTLVDIEKNIKHKGRWGTRKGKPVFQYAEPTFPEHHGDVREYLRLCEEYGLEPVFPQFVYRPDGSLNENFYKVIIDRKLYDNNGNYIEQQVVQPEFDDAVLQDMLLNYTPIQADPHGPTVQQALRDIRDGKVTNFAIRRVEMAPAKGEKTRTFAKSVAESELTADETAEIIVKANPSYKPISNQATIDEATPIVEQNPDAWDERRATGGRLSARDIAVGEVTIRKLESEGNHAGAARVALDMAIIATEAGQVVQAFSIIKRLTPAGMVMYAKRAVDTMAQAMKDKFPKIDIAKLPKLTEEEAAALMRLMEHREALRSAEKDSIDAYRTALTDALGHDVFTSKQLDYWLGKLEKRVGRTKFPLDRLAGFADEFDQIVLGKVMRTIADKAPVTIWERLKGLRRITLLANAKTQARNIGGNVLLSAIANVSDTVAVPIDIAVSLFTNERTTVLPSLRTQTGQLAGGVQQVIDEFMSDVDTSAVDTLEGGRYETRNQRIFNNRYLHWLHSVTISALRMGDMPFYRAQYADALRRYMTARNLTEVTREADEFATRIALERTYQDTNRLTRAALGLRKILNLGAEFGFGDLVLPFAKTPANVLARALDYSVAVPLVQTVLAAGANQQGFNQAEFVTQLSRTLTGAGLLWAGYTLASMGLLSGKQDDDKRKREFDKASGDLPYAFRINGTNYTYDWAQPSSMSLAIGANWFYSGLDKVSAAERIKQSVISGGDTLFAQSFLQGLRGLTGGYGSSTSEAIFEQAAESPTQWIPTVSGQLARTIDPIKRETGFRPELQALAKIPFASKLLPPKMDTLGKPQRYGGGAIGQFVLPWNSAQRKNNAVVNELRRMYKATKDSSILPLDAPKKMSVDKVPVTLTTADRQFYMETFGKAYESEMLVLLNMDTYQALPDEDKLGDLRQTMEDARQMAKEAVLERKGLK